MPSSNSHDIKETLALLQSLLTSENCQLLIRSLDKHVLDDKQRQLLAQLNAHFAPTLGNSSGSFNLPTPAPSPRANDNEVTHHIDGASASRKGKRARPEAIGDEEDDIEDSDGDGPQPRKRRAKWAPMDGLVKVTDLLPEVKDFWYDNRHDPRAVFSDPHTQHEPAGERLQKQITKGDEGEYLVFCVDFVDRFNNRRLIDSVRVIFSYLACYDLFMTLNNGSNRNWTGAKFGAVVRRRIKDEVLGDVQFTDNAMENQVISSFEDYVQRGRKLSQLCAELGEGCLFRFASRLTDKFIDRSLKQKGEVYDRVLAALTATGMVQDDEDTGLTQFGKRVRSSCQVRFQGPPVDTDTSSNEGSSSGSR